MATLTRVFQTSEPFDIDYTLPAYSRGKWPGNWIAHPDSEKLPAFIAYKLELTIDKPFKSRIQVSADERYHLYIDGDYRAMGSERGDESNWYFESYELDLTPGKHVIVALVWSLGDKAPIAQMTVRHGFLLVPGEKENLSLLGTGVASWQSKRIEGIELVDRQPLFGVGDKQKFVGTAYDHRFTVGVGENWLAPIKVEAPIRWDGNDVEKSHYLRPSTLPPMMHEPWRVARVRNVSAPPAGPTTFIPIKQVDDITGERSAWTDLLTGGSINIPPNTRRRVIVDLENYLCAYTHLVTQGGAGAQIRVHWQESLFDDFQNQGKVKSSWTKSNRDEIEGKFFTSMWMKRDGVGDEFWPAGRDREEFMSLWFSCGRYVEIYVATADEPLTIKSLTLFETRYPLNLTEAPFKCDDVRWNKLSEICLRTLQMCSHETFFDCPYFEQLQYIGDTRIQALLTMTVSPDDRLVRKALQILDWSRISNTGFTQSRYPSRSRQMIPTFSLWWVCIDRKSVV